MIDFQNMSVFQNHLIIRKTNYKHGIGRYKQNMHSNVI